MGGKPERAVTGPMQATQFSPWGVYTLKTCLHLPAIASLSQSSPEIDQTQAQPICLKASSAFHTLLMLAILSTSNCMI